jgi:hypothetical protein
MFRFVLPILVTVSAAAIPASAQDASDASQPAAEKPAKEKKICKTDTGTGSIMPKRTCRTKVEWDALTEQSRGNLDRSRNVTNGTSMVGGMRGQ